MRYRLGVSAFAILGAGLLGASQQSPPTLRSNNASRALAQITAVNVSEVPCETGSVSGWPVLTNFDRDTASALATSVHGFLSQCSTKADHQRIFRIAGCGTALKKLDSEPTFWSHTAVSNKGAGKEKQNQCLLVLYPTFYSEFPCLRTINGENEMLCTLNPEKYDIHSWEVKDLSWRNDKFDTDYFNQTGQQVSKPVPSRDFSFGLLGYRALVDGEEFVPVSGYFEIRTLADMTLVTPDGNTTKTDSFYFRSNFGSTSSGGNPDQKNGKEINLSKEYARTLTRVIEIRPKDTCPSK